MLIYLVRHGKAEQKALRDQDRELTREGLMETRAMVAKFRLQATSMDMAVMSPYQRARQTASIMRVAIPGMRFEPSELLTPNADVYELLETIESYRVMHVLLVSHNPLLSNLLSLMIDATLETSRHMDTSHLVCVEMDCVAPGCGEIRYTMSP